MPLKTLFIGTAALLSVSLAESVSAGPLEEVQVFSVIKDLKPSRLAAGDIAGNRAVLPTAPLAFGVETAFFAPATAAKVLAELQDDESSTSTEASETLDKETHFPMAPPFTPKSFDALKFDASRGHVRNFLKKCEKAGPGKHGLHLSASEAKTLAEAVKAASGSGDGMKAGAPLVADAWRRILTGRANAFLNGGAAALAPYQNESKPFAVGPELRRVMASRPGVASRFEALLAAALDGAPLEEAAAPARYYWESSKIQAEATYNLGALFSRAAGPGFRALEIQYYVTSRYYTSLILYEILPASLEGKEGSLVWRGDYVITPDIPYLKAVEKMAAEQIMLIEVKKSIRGFVEECR